jgi:hypothetical protein
VALVFVLRFYAFEMYWKIIWLTWCIILFQYSYLEKVGVALFFQIFQIIARKIMLREFI